MALSLKDVKGSKLPRASTPPVTKKALVMPWQDRPPPEEVAPAASTDEAPESEPIQSQNEAKTELDRSQEARPPGETEPIRSHNRANSEPNRSRPLVKPTARTTGAKTKPIRSQNGAGSKPIQSQFEAKTEPDRSQADSSSRAGATKNGATFGAGSKPIQSQIEAKAEPSDAGAGELEDLSRLQLKCLRFVFESCRFSGSRLSERVFCAELAERLKSTPAAVKKAFQRLEAGAFVQRDTFKKGPGGWTRYRLPEGVYRELSVRDIRANSEPDRSQIGARTEPQIEPQTEPSGPSSSSPVVKEENLKATTTADDDADLLPPEWRRVDFLPLSEQNCPFGPRQVRQARSFGMSPEALQESIYNFAWALSQQWEPEGRFQTSPLNFFMGCLKRSGLFEHEGYYRQRQARRQREEAWLTARRDASNDPHPETEG